MQGIVFEESQRMSIWLRMIALAVSCLALYALFSNPPKEPASIGVIILIIFILAISNALIWLLRLDIVINAQGLYYRLFPFHLKFRKVGWDEVRFSYVRQYRPIMEYGGWGLRLGIFGSGYAINVSGNQGIQLVFHESRRLLIGTQRPQEVEIALKQVGQFKPEMA